MLSLLLRYLERRKYKPVEVIRFPSSSIAEPRIVGYIYYLKSKYKFKHIGYKIKKDRRTTSKYVSIITYRGNKELRNFFKYTNPEIARLKCARSEPMDACISSWMGFEEVIICLPPEDCS